MNTEIVNSIALPPELPTVVLYLLSAVGLAAWAGIHVLRRPVSSRGRRAHFVLRAAIGFLALVVIADTAQRHWTFATNWPVAPILLLGAVGAEAVLALYALERTLVTARVGMTLAVLRVLIVLGLTAMLCQPVRVFEFSRKVERNVAILLDDSASMRIKESGMTPAEKVRLAEMLSIKDAARPQHFDQVARRLKKLQQELAGHTDWLLSIGPTEPVARSAQFDKRARPLRDFLKDAQKTLAEQTNAITAPLTGPLLKSDNPTRGLLSEIAGRLATDVNGRFTEVLQVIDALYSKDKDKPKPTDGYEKALDGIRRASAALVELEPKLTQAGDAMDELFFNSLPAPARKKIDDSVLRMRSDLARDLLLHHRVLNFETGSTDPNLLERLQDKYGTKLYTFNSEASETDAKALAASYAGTETNVLAAGPAQRTDIAGAIEKAARDIPADRLAGILLLTDGRHNGSGQVEPAARALGLKQVPIHSVVFGGGRRPPTDAGIIFAEAPDTVYTNDRVYISADLKLDGLAGTNVLVSLYNGSNLVATTLVAAVTESFRKRVQLADQPRTNGLHFYRIAVQEFAEEVTYSNNTYSLPVTVMDDRTRLLVIEDRPRWEFRYLKNLFSGRDSSVSLQHVLFHPDDIAGMPPHETVHASASRPPTETEATAVPETMEEWMKFDVIILGDVKPEELGEDAMKAIHKFVADRGGTLIVLSGPLYMPHAYGDTPVADLLPVTFEPDTRPVLAGPEAGFKLRLTDEGRDSVIMRLAVDPVENDDIWKGIPDIHWRHAVKGTKEGATVLAYAVPNLPPDYMQLSFEGGVPDENTLRLRREYQLDNPLIVMHHMAQGRVLFLGFDHTWRLRYRVGDTYHHKFWGQLLRWGTGDKLAYGTTFVRIGAERSRYVSDASVKVRARVMKRDYAPVNDARASVNVFSGDRRVLRKALQYVPDSAGVYATDLGPLPVGDYRVELDSSDAEDILKSDNLKTVSGWFSVTSAFPFELAELAADRGLLSRVASLTGGKVVEPAQLYEMTDEFGPPSVTVRERRQYDLWNSWWLFALLIGMASAEWIVRKKVSLP